MRIQELTSSRELLWNLTLRELRGKYRRSALGWAWSLLNPLATTVMYTFVFAIVLDAKGPVGEPSGLHVYAFFLLTGLLPWNFFVVGTTQAMSSVIANGGLVKKVWFPREVLVHSTVLAAGGVVADRAGPAVHDPAVRREHGAPVDPGRSSCSSLS